MSHAQQYVRESAGSSLFPAGLRYLTATELRAEVPTLFGPLENPKHPESLSQGNTRLALGAPYFWSGHCSR